MPSETREPQYQPLAEMEASGTTPSLGLMAGFTWKSDPKRLAFTLSRYKFVARMLEGRDRVLEVGAADAWASRIVKQTVGELTVTDFDPFFTENGNNNVDPAWPMRFETHDFVASPFPKRFDAAFAMDVLEHIPPADEDQFMRNICASLIADGVAIIGMPSLESQVYASAESLAGHVNCKSGQALKDFLSDYFRQVFMFSMNDEVVHTGFFKMSHYLIGLCVMPRADS